MFSQEAGNGKEAEMLVSGAEKVEGRGSPPRTGHDLEREHQGPYGS